MSSRARETLHDLRRVALWSMAPINITLEPLPPRSPELNPVERLWLFLKQKFLPHRLLDDYEAIEAAVCAAWKRVIGEAGRLTSLTSYPWIMDCVSL